MLARIRRVPSALRALAADPRNRRDGLLATLSGVLCFLAFPSHDIWPLGWVAQIPLLWTLRDASPKRAFWVGWLMGFVTNTGGFYWITGLLVRFGGIPMPLAIPICLLMTAYQGLIFALATAFWRRAVAWGQPGVLAYPAALVVAEWLLPFVFPWYLSNGQYLFHTFIQAAELGGVLLLGYAMAAFSIGVLRLLEVRDGREKRPRPWELLAAFAPVIFCLAYGALRLPQIDTRIADAQKADEVLKVGVVQANIGIIEKSKNRERNLRVHREMSQTLAKQGADLVVWPETASGEYFHTDTSNPRFGRAMRRVTGGIDVPMLFGALRYHKNPDTGRNEIWNTAILAGPQGEFLGWYDKVYLLIFGEYVPVLGAYPELLEKILPNSSQLGRGDRLVSLELPRKGDSEAAPWRLGPMICYEDILPIFARKMALAADPQAFINVTNDAWFGDTKEPYQHMALSVFRAVEHRIPLIRAVNTGTSVHVDAAGRIQDQIMSYQKDSFIADMVPLDSDTVYRSFGDWIAWLCAAYWVLAWWRRQRS